ncbi:hypothetical protein BH18GEM1_BH18GEM1_15550 [soil metagenome]
MPRIVQRQNYNGGSERIARLGLQMLWAELEEILTLFDLRVAEQRDANGGAAVRRLIDERFLVSQGWVKSQTGGVDWRKCLTINGAQVCLGVEVQFSGRSESLIVDVDHLREAITSGSLDVGVVVVPSDSLSI